MYYAISIAWQRPLFVLSKKLEPHRFVFSALAKESTESWMCEIFPGDLLTSAPSAGILLVHFASVFQSTKRRLLWDPSPVILKKEQLLTALSLPISAVKSERPAFYTFRNRCAALVCLEDARQYQQNENRKGIQKI